MSNSLKKDKNAKKHEKKSKESNNLKTVLTKMVPYFNMTYAEHVLLTLG